MNRRIATIVVAVSMVCPGSLRAQAARLADSLLRRGMLDRAESEYYAAVRVRPRDPNARWALGRYLVSRGASRIGAVLIDEAVQFGFDKRIAGPALAKVYMDLGEYQALASLAGSPLSGSEKALVHWLIEHPSKTSSPDSTVLVAFARSNLDGYVGAARIRVNGQPLVALVSSRGGCGIRISDTSSVVRKLRQYPADGIGPAKVISAAADSVGYGRLSITNVPVTVETLRDGGQAVICLGALMRYAPTFDPKAGLLTLRLGGTAPPPASGTEFPFLNSDGQFSIARAGGWVPIVLPPIASTLKDHRWTLDTKRGAIVVEP